MISMTKLLPNAPIFQQNDLYKTSTNTKKCFIKYIQDKFNLQASQIIPGNMPIIQ